VRGTRAGRRAPGTSILQRVAASCRCGRRSCHFQALVGCRPQLPRRLGGCCGRRSQAASLIAGLHRDAADERVQRALSDRRLGAGCAIAENVVCRPARRRARLRLLDREHSARCGCSGAAASRSPGVIAFIFADLIIPADRQHLPEVTTAAGFAALLVAVMFVAMAGRGPGGRCALLAPSASYRRTGRSIESIAERPITWNYTSALGPRVRGRVRRAGRALTVPSRREGPRVAG